MVLIKAAAIVLLSSYLYLLPPLACIGACQSTSLLSSHSGHTFQIRSRFDPDVSHALHSNESPLFWLLRLLDASGVSPLAAHRCICLLISEPGENHTAPYCPQASAARRHRSPSRQADNTLVLCQQLNTEIRHGQRCTTIDSTDWSGAHSWL